MARAHVLLLIALFAASCQNGPSGADQASEAVQTDDSSAPGYVLQGSASAITHPPESMDGINGLHENLRDEGSEIRFGTHADPKVITLGPTSGGTEGGSAYEGKLSMNLQMPLLTPVLAPLDLKFVGFYNRSARYRADAQSSSGSQRIEPFDDLELCFESTTEDWPGLVMCAYHLRTSPLLRGHLVSPECGIREEWPGNQRWGRMMFLENDGRSQQDDWESCEPVVGREVTRGSPIGYAGTVGDNPHVAFKFKVGSAERNHLTESGDPYLHWVQPATFFFWKCHAQDAVFPKGVLAYPVECGGGALPAAQRDPAFKY